MCVQAGGTARSPPGCRRGGQYAYQLWLAALLAARPGDIDALQASQEHVGQVHARIGIPVDLVARGGRMLKDDLHAGIRRHAGSDRLALDAIVCADGLVDIALESMTPPTPARARPRARSTAPSGCSR